MENKNGTPDLNHSTQKEEPISFPDQRKNFGTPAHIFPLFLPKKIALIILILIFVVFITGFITTIYNLGKSSSTTSNQVLIPQTPSPFPVSENVSNWKTFVSKYGYSFKYPSELTASDYHSKTDVEQFGTEIGNKDEIIKKYGSADNYNKDYFEMYVSYSPYEDTDLQTIKDRYSHTKITNLTVGNEPGIKVNIEGDPTPKVRYLYIITAHNKKSYRFGLQTLDSKYSSYFDQIISTFKFTKQEAVPSCTPRPTCLDNPTSMCDPIEPAGGWCSP